MTGLGGLGVPTFQAVRPWARSLSVSQGKGATRGAAMVSALLEAVELDAAERLVPPPGAQATPLARLGEEALRCWSAAPRDPLATALDPGRARPWLQGRDLLSGRRAAVPFDLLSLDFTRAPPPDLTPTSAGLAIGNTAAEALAAGAAELVERDLAARLERLPPRARRRVELDLWSVDCPSSRALLTRFARAGHAVRVWSMGQDAGVAAFACLMFRTGDGRSDAAPAGGSGCHPDRRVALARALLEAAQARATLVAGARDDLRPEDYRGGGRAWAELVLGALSIGPGPLDWARTPHDPGASAEADLDRLLAVAARLSPLPVIAYAHAPPHPALRLRHAVAPGLLDRARGGPRGGDPRRAPPAPAPAVLRRAPRRPVLFAGPSLPAGWADPAVELRPPAACGDLAALLDDPPPAVGLADGVFEVAPTVSHKELLDLLAHGAAVLGAASLGAIRAAELAPFGMRGVGCVFALYAAGLVARDDAVMLAHAPPELGHRPLTLALVDAEAALLATPMPAAERRALQRIARTTPFAERTWRRCLDAYARRTGRRAGVDPLALAAVPSLKERDALALAAMLRTAGPGAAGPRPPLTGDHLRVLALSRAAPPPRPAGSGGAPPP